MIVTFMLYLGWLRKIEGEFGTVIYQYFLFARSLIFLNIICALAWVSHYVFILILVLRHIRLFS